MSPFHSQVLNTHIWDMSPKHTHSTPRLVDICQTWCRHKYRSRLMRAHNERLHWATSFGETRKQIQRKGKRTAREQKPSKEQHNCCMQLQSTVKHRAWYCHVFVCVYGNVCLCNCIIDFLLWFTLWTSRSCNYPDYHSRISLSADISDIISSWHWMQHKKAMFTYLRNIYILVLPGAVVKAVLSVTCQLHSILPHSDYFIITELAHFNNLQHFIHIMQEMP